MPPDDDLIDAAPCPKCRAPLSVAVADLGHLIECPSCGAQSRARRAEPPAAREPESRRPRDSESDSRQERERDSDWGDESERRPPRKRNRRDDDEDRLDENDDDRPRRRSRPRPRDEDYDEQPRRRPGQGAAITAAVMNFVFAVIALLEGGCSGMGGVGLLSEGPRGGRGGPFGGPENAGMVFLGFGICNLIGVGLMIPSGVGLLTRKPFGRTLGFLAAGLGLIYALSITIGFLVLIGEGRGGPPPVGAVFIVILGVLLWLAYAITNLILLGKVRSDPR